MLLVRLMLYTAVFAINAATKGNVIDALLFATSVAVGITPQMLPVIVTTSPVGGQGPRPSPGYRQGAAGDSKPRSDGRPVLRQDRHPHRRPHRCSSATNTGYNEDARVLLHAFLE